MAPMTPMTPMTPMAPGSYGSYGSNGAAWRFSNLLFDVDSLSNLILFRSLYHIFRFLKCLLKNEKGEGPKNEQKHI